MSQVSETLQDATHAVTYREFPTERFIRSSRTENRFCRAFKKLSNCIKWIQFNPICNLILNFCFVRSVVGSAVQCSSVPLAGKSASWKIHAHRHQRCIKHSQLWPSAARGPPSRKSFQRRQRGRVVGMGGACCPVHSTRCHFDGRWRCVPLALLVHFKSWVVPGP